MQLRSYFFFSWLLVIISGQRYAERNVPVADAYTSPNPDLYDYDYENEYSFQEEEPNIHKWNVEKFPHPVNTPHSCNRLKSSHVCDPDLVLETEQADMLDRTIEKLYRDTPCICDTCKDNDGGIVVGIALLKHMFHPYNVHPAKVIRTFAETLRSRWKLGRCDNDILIVVATTDRLSYTDVGKTTSDYLSIHEAHRIFLENKSKFTAFNFSEGLMDILDGYRRTTENMIARDSRKNLLDGNIPVIAGAIVGSVLLLGVLLFVGFVIYKRCKNKKDESDEELDQKRGSTVSSSWSKKDIKVIFGPEKSKAPALSNVQYQKCGIDEVDNAENDEEETLDFTLATPQDTSFQEETRLTNVTSDSETLEKDLTTAAEGIVRTFPSSNGSKLMVTDM